MYSFDCLVTNKIPRNAGSAPANKQEAVVWFRKEPVKGKSTESLFIGDGYLNTLVRIPIDSSKKKNMNHAHAHFADITTI